MASELPRLDVRGPDFSVTSSWDAVRSCLVVLIGGELDLMNVRRLRAVLTEHIGDIEVDCAGLRFIDSSGLGLFMVVHSLQRQRGRRLTLRRLRPSCYASFELTGLTDILDVSET